MKLLIKLASLILFSLPLIAQASVNSEKIEISIQKFEEKLGRELDAKEFTAMEELLSNSSQAKSSPLIKTGGRSYVLPETAKNDESTSLKMLCLQFQLSVIVSGKGLICLSENGEIYRIAAMELGAILEINASVIYVSIDANESPYIIRNIRRGSQAHYNFDGIGASIYWHIGMQAQYYKGEGNSTMIMSGGGFGYGGGIYFATLPSLIISKW